MRDLATNLPLADSALILLITCFVETGVEETAMFLLFEVSQQMREIFTSIIINY